MGYYDYGYGNDANGAENDDLNNNANQQQYYDDNGNADDAGAAAAADGEGQSAICLVYDAEDSFTAFVQALLAFIALASLYLKRHREIPRRRFETWFMDVSKQGIGAIYAHVLNMIIAALIVANVRGDFVLEDQCAWYATMYVMDTVVGLVLSIYLLALLDKVSNARNWTTLMHSGVYVGPDRYITWGHQILAWLLILTVVKAILTFLMWAASPILGFWAAILFAPFDGNTRMELLFVMIVFPGFLNVIWFWITDQYLKAEKHHAGAHEPTDEALLEGQPGYTPPTLDYVATTAVDDYDAVRSRSGQQNTTDDSQPTMV